MSRIAVDVVLLPSEKIIKMAIEINDELVEKFGRKIVFNEDNCLPHISLAMGCIEESDISDIKRILRMIAKQYPAGELQITGIQTSSNAVGEKVSAFEIERTERLQLLHKNIMSELAEYFTSDVTKDMVADGDVEDSTLMWIRDYREKSSFENFSPHITLGYGEIPEQVQPMKLVASKLALCHLGNHCTCRRILASIEL